MPEFIGTAVDHVLLIQIGGKPVQVEAGETFAGGNLPVHLPVEQRRRGAAEGRVNDHDCVTDGNHSGRQVEIEHAAGTLLKITFLVGQGAVACLLHQVTCLAEIGIDCTGTLLPVGAAIFVQID